MKNAWLLCALALLPTAPFTWAAPAASKPVTSKYDPQALFAPFHYQEPVNRYRAANGRPGPDYWQNRADYEIHATLDPKAKTPTGIETITYTNNSPQPLDYLWLQLDQSLYRTDARGSFTRDRAPKFDAHTEGDVITSVEVLGDQDTVKAAHIISDTRMRVDLPQPVATWMQRTQFDVPIADSKRIERATIDPDGKLPDAGRTNNTFTMSTK